MKAQQRGVALLVVLLIVALMTLLAANVTERSGRAYLNTAGLVARQQAKWYATAAEAMASKIVLLDARDSPHKTHLAQYWAQEGRQFPVEGGEIAGTILDGQACFNLNTVSQGENAGASYPAQAFRYLLQNLGEEPQRAAHITDALRDWIDTDRVAQRNGAEDEAYMSLIPPYRPANQPLADVSELRAVLGVDTALYQRLLPYVCVLPKETLLVNINTLPASQGVLLAALLLNEITPADATQRLQNRPREGWSSVTAFLADGGAAMPNAEKAKSVLTVNSHYFFTHVSVRLGESDYRRHALLQREGNQIHVLQRHDQLSLKVAP